jgi:signal transduction histidine kinase
MDVFDTKRLEAAAVAVAGLGMCVVAAVVTTAGSASKYDWLEGLARATMVGAPIAVGVYARRRRPFERFGTLLIAVGAGWFLTTLSGSRDDVLYSVGRTSAWIVEAGIIYLVLAFPSGRLSGRVDRLLFGAMTVVVVALYLPTALLVDAYPIPSPPTACHTACPHNAFMIVDAEPGFVDGIVRPLRDFLTAAIFAAVTVRLGVRIRGATQLMRRTLEPVLVVAIVRLAILAVGTVARRVAPNSDILEISSWLVAFTLPAMAAAFLVGLARWRMFTAAAMQRLAMRLHAHPQPEELRAALADAFDDPTLEIAYWLDHGDGNWVDAQGKEVQAPPPASGRCLTEVRDGERLVAALFHDEALRDDQAFIAIATSYSVFTLDHQRLSMQAATLVREVHESRARIQLTADDERRRIERDIHDGAQQRLVALRINLELAAEQTEPDDPDRAKVLRGLGTDVDTAIDQVRDLARGIYPGVLADHGLVAALRAAALQSALPTTVLAAGVQRYSREIESAAYFCCLEALQNTDKHAHGATAAVVDVSDNGVLRMEVRDDGAGFDPATAGPGAGLVNMRDRLAAVRGELETRSSPGRGTRLIVTIPLDSTG